MGQARVALALIGVGLLVMTVRNGGARQSAPAAIQPSPDPNAMPADISALTTKWGNAEDQCRGGYGRQERACAKRDKLESEIADKGWCVHYAERPRSEDAWHQCSDEETKEIGAEEVRVADAKTTATFAAADHVKEVEQALLNPSPALTAFDKAMQPYEARYAQATVIWECGLASSSWISGYISSLDRQLISSSYLKELRGQISDKEGWASGAAMKQDRDITYRFYKNAGCQEVAAMPFVERMINGQL